MGEPIKRAYSRDELIHLAQQFMIENYGQPHEATDKENWYAHLGMLTHFVIRHFPTDESNHGDEHGLGTKNDNR